MRKILTLISVIACLSIISSCKKSDKKQIIGTWECKTLHSKAYLDGALQSDDNWNPEPDEYTLEFRDDDTYTTYEFGIADNSGTYSLSDDQLTVDGNPSSYVLSKTSLQVSSVNEEQLNGHTVRYETEATFERK